MIILFNIIVICVIWNSCLNKLYPAEAAPNSPQKWTGSRQNWINMTIATSFNFLVVWTLLFILSLFFG
jgi:hypothetical protein